jgi:hypothetical protein
MSNIKYYKFDIDSVVWTVIDNYAKECTVIQLTFDLDNEGDKLYYHLHSNDNSSEVLIRREFEVFETESDATEFISNRENEITPTPTITPTTTVTPNVTSTNIATPTITPTVTQTSTVTPTQTATPTNTPTATPTNTPTQTVTPTNTPTATPTNTPTQTVTPTNTPTQTATPTITPTTSAPSTLLNGLVSWWTMDETSGVRVDSHGGLTLTDINTVGFTTGKQGTAAQFVSNNQEFLDSNAATASTLAGRASDFSMAFWIYPSSSINMSVMQMYQFGSRTQIDWAFVAQFASSNRFYFQIRNTPGASGTRRDVYSSTGYALNNWYLCYCEYEHTANRIRLSINDADQQETDTSAITVPAAEGTALSIGKGVVVDYCSMGFDEYAFWNRRLTSGEVTLLYNSGSGISYSDLS